MRSLSRQAELEHFKSAINLVDFISDWGGFTRDEPASSTRYTVLRSTSGEKINVSRGANRHWRYVNVHDARDAGTIIDFVQTRDRNSLGEVRKVLRNWLGRAPSSTAKHQAVRLQSASTGPNRDRVRRDWRNASPITGPSHYLFQARGIAPELIAGPLFHGRVRTDRRHGNALFAHFDSEGLCGFEAKNDGFTGFSPGGAKGLFCSRPRDNDRELVVCETAIDALSYAMLFGTDGRMFVSTAGQLSARQIKLLQKAASRLSMDRRIVLAVDNDDGGQRFEATLRQAFAGTGWGEDAVETHLPDTPGDDWNAVLLDSAPRITPGPQPQLPT